MRAKKTDVYSTPGWILKIFEGWYDPCHISTGELRAFDGLGSEWKDKTYVNPPYSDPLPWVQKAIAENKEGKMIVMLLRMDTSTKWFAELMQAKAELLWFSRGCIRKCPFCVVHEKEGMIHPVEPKNLNPNGKYIKVTDNNFFANPEWDKPVKQLKKWGQPVDFQCGIDVRIFNEAQGEALKSLKLHKYLYIAWDNPREDITEKIELLNKYVKPYKILCYVLIGYWSTEEEDMYRCEKLRSMNIDPFVMPYDKHNHYQMHFTRWVNHKAVWNTVKWEDYSRR